MTDKRTTTLSTEKIARARAVAAELVATPAPCTNAWADMTRRGLVHIHAYPTRPLDQPENDYEAEVNREKVRLLVDRLSNADLRALAHVAESLDFLKADADFWRHVDDVNEQSRQYFLERFPVAGR